VTITGRGAMTAIDSEKRRGSSDYLYYAISSVDRLGNESPLSPAIRFTFASKPISQRHKAMHP
jgi:hypothetical protein